MHLRQPLVLDAQLHAARRIHLDHVHKVPGNAVSGKLARDCFKRSARQHAFEDPSKGSAQAHLHFRHAQQVGGALAHPLQVHVVYAHHLPAVDIDDLAVHQVLLQVEIVALVLQGNHRA